LNSNNDKLNKILSKSFIDGGSVNNKILRNNETTLRRCNGEVVFYDWGLSCKVDGGFLFSIPIKLTDNTLDT
jgi:hypothetical protein